MSLESVSRSRNFFRPCMECAHLPKGYRLSDLLHWQLNITPAHLDKLQLKYPDILTADDSFEPLISRAVSDDNRDLIEYMVKKNGKIILELGAYITGETPLFSAADCDYTTLKKVIELGANINAITSKDLQRWNAWAKGAKSAILLEETVLERYVRKMQPHCFSQRKCVKMLLSRGACIQDPTALTIDQKKMLQNVLDELHLEIPSVLARVKDILLLLHEVAIATDVHATVIDYAIEENQVDAFEFIKLHMRKKAT